MIPLSKSFSLKYNDDIQKDGNVIENSITNWPGMQAWDSINGPMCDEQKAVFDDPDDHGKKGEITNCICPIETRTHKLAASFFSQSKL